MNDAEAATARERLPRCRGCGKASSGSMVGEPGRFGTRVHIVLPGSFGVSGFRNTARTSVRGCQATLLDDGLSPCCSLNPHRNEGESRGGGGTRQILEQNAAPGLGASPDPGVMPITAPSKGAEGNVSKGWMLAGVQQ